MQKVVLATGNAGKVRELASLLEDFGLDIVAQTELGVESADWSIYAMPKIPRRWCATAAGLG